MTRQSERAAIRRATKSCIEREAEMTRYHRIGHLETSRPVTNPRLQVYLLACITTPTVRHAPNLRAPTVLRVPEVDPSPWDAAWERAALKSAREQRGGAL